MVPTSPADQATQWFIFQNNNLLVIKEGSVYTLPAECLMTAMQPHLIRQHAFGEFNDKACFCAEIDEKASLPAAVEAVSLRSAFNLLSNDWYKPAVKAFSIINWDRNHQFCSRCSHFTVHKIGSFERICSACGLAFYPRISPCMIVLIKKDDHVLMARSPYFVKGVYGLIAGFIEAGESIEEAVHREVKEEVNINIKNLQYFGSQPWPFPDSLMIGFTADYASGDIMIDNKEIEAADWYRFDKLPGRPTVSISIASQLIEHFVAEQKGKTYGNV